MVEELLLCLGGRIGYWAGDVKKLMSDIEALQPTILPGVPRIFERIYAGVQEKVLRGGGWGRGATILPGVPRIFERIYVGVQEKVVRGGGGVAVGGCGGGSGGEGGGGRGVCGEASDGWMS